MLAVEFPSFYKEEKNKTIEFEGFEEFVTQTWPQDDSWIIQYKHKLQWNFVTFYELQ